MSGLLRRIKRSRAAGAGEDPAEGQAAATEGAPTTAETAAGGDAVKVEPARTTMQEARAPLAQADPSVPAGLDPAEAAAGPATGRRGRLRRRLRYLRRARELMLRDLGGLLYEVHRTGGGDVAAHATLVGAKVERLVSLDAEASSIETALGAPRSEAVVFQPGVGGTCDFCGELYGSAARFCSNCGSPTGSAVRATPAHTPPPRPLPAMPKPPAAATGERPTETLAPLGGAAAAGREEPAGGVEASDQTASAAPAERPAAPASESAAADETAGVAPAARPEAPASESTAADETAGVAQPEAPAGETDAPAEPPDAAGRRDPRAGRRDPRPGRAVRAAGRAGRRGRHAGGWLDPAGRPGRRGCRAQPVRRHVERARRRRHAARALVRRPARHPGALVSSVETPPPAEPPAPEQPAARRCPRCGTALSEQQEWCLSCGAAVGTRVVAAPGWRTPLVIAGVIAAIAAIAVAIAIVQLADDTDAVAQNPPAAAPTPQPAATPAPPTVTPEPELTPDATLPEASGEETPEPAATPERGSASADAKWPAGESGWTVVLASDTSESDARDKADGFASDGIAGVGVLDSDDFSSLKAGFWVVFAGRYDSQSEAGEALDGIDAKDAYIRRIDPA